MDILSSWFSSGIGVIILNVPGDFMCENVMFDTNHEAPDITKTTYRPCGQPVNGQSRDKSMWSKLWSRKRKTLKIRVFRFRRLFLAWSALHGCLVSSASNLLDITSISCPLRPILMWIWSIFSISTETIEKTLDNFLHYEVLNKFTGRLTQLKICRTN